MVFARWCTSDVTNRAQTYAMNDQRIVLKCRLNGLWVCLLQHFMRLEHLKCFCMCLYFNLIPERHGHGLKLKSDNFKVYRRRSNICIFLRTLKRSRVALNHLPKKTFTGIYRPSFLHSTTRSLIDLKVSHMVKINFSHKVLLLH